MFFKKKQEQPHKTYDHENKKPMIKASICNGEQVAGFKDVHTGTFEEVMLIRDSAFYYGFSTLKFTGSAFEYSSNILVRFVSSGESRMVLQVLLKI